MDAPYSGGYVAGGRVFAVSGDFTRTDPCGPPEIYFPLAGDSVPSVWPIILLDRSQNPPVYVSLPVGQGFNVQDFNSMQATMVLEQEFMVAEAYYAPMPLNRSYNPAWSVGWGVAFVQDVDLTELFLVEEGPLKPVGAGLAIVKRKFANLPPNRNEFESYNATFPALDDGSGNIRFGFSKIVNSRVFYEYFLFDDLDLQLGIPEYPAGHRINTLDVGTNIIYLLWEETKFFKAVANAIGVNNVLDPDQPLTDNGDGNGTPTTPSFTTYFGWMGSGSAAAVSEIIAEASSFTRWMGNIFVRRTRFVLAQ